MQNMGYDFFVVNTKIICMNPRREASEYSIFYMHFSETKADKIFHREKTKNISEDKNNQDEKYLRRRMLGISIS